MILGFVTVGFTFISLQYTAMGCIVFKLTYFPFFAIFSADSVLNVKKRELFRVRYSLYFRVFWIRYNKLRKLRSEKRRHSLQALVE